MLKKVEAAQKGRSHMSMQTVQPKSDPVLKWTARFIVAGMILGIIPMSIAAIYSGQAPGTGVAGIIVCLGIAGGMLSLMQKDS